MSSASPDIRTRLLIISDTHGKRPFDPSIHPEEAQRYGFHRPLPKADVAVHCGDLTIRSDVKEYQTTFDIMREIDAPLKVVIPGNHDGSMDAEFWEKDCVQRGRFLPPEFLARLHQQPQETYEVVEKARQDGIHVLVAEGTYHFVLANGARLTVYASPWTPRFGRWGFQYDPDDDAMQADGEGAMVDGHDFQIEEGTDLAMTHGPPYGILDRTGYGALLMPWEDEDGSMVVEREGGVADEAVIQPVSLCPGDTGNLGSVPGKNTLFVNAAIMNVHYKPHQSPWLVDLELPPPDEKHEVKAEKTKKVLSLPITHENAKSRTPGPTRAAPDDGLAAALAVVPAATLPVAPLAPLLPEADDTPDVVVVASEPEAPDDTAVPVALAVAVADAESEAHWAAPAVCATPRSAGLVQAERRQATACSAMADCEAQGQAASVAGVQTAEMAERRQGVLGDGEAGCCCEEYKDGLHDAYGWWNGIRVRLCG
ncbi:hypothetical protein VMCG_02080 [Cytospora schulzeri]|uniref:Calcineurin-like phosphoesterase domain-containing protein n=1 Tax=Cytospora schulzeri TaxID=448051 RepID=A0A423X4F5_9PEZI|nr:hypothetical protein VMCG_02080 [Valsa malicola]